MSLAVAQVSEQQQFLVRASFLEIYNEEVRDLLSKNPKNKLELKERKEQGVYVKGLNSFVVKSVAEITSVLEVCDSVPPSVCTQRACMFLGQRSPAFWRCVAVFVPLRALREPVCLWGQTRQC